jgi:hypothetical protein
MARNQSSQQPAPEPKRFKPNPEGSQPLNLGQTNLSQNRVPGILTNPFGKTHTTPPKTSRRETKIFGNNGNNN